MTIEEFKQELFALLYNARKMKTERLFTISKDKFSVPVADIRVYMDSEMQYLVTLYPYSFSYVSSESTPDQLTFIDIVPDVKENEKEVELTNYYYDCEKKSIGMFITTLSLKD